MSEATKAIKELILASVNVRQDTGGFNLSDWLDRLESISHSEGKIEGFERCEKIWNPKHEG